MTVIGCGCGFRSQDWELDCDIDENNGVRCGVDPDGRQVVWAPPDDGVLHFSDEPTIKSAYRNSLGASYDPVSQGVGDFNITAADCVITWTNSKCHDYWVLTEFVMGTPVFELGNGAEVYIGSHNILTLTDPDNNDDVIVDANPSVGKAYGPSAIGGLVPVTEFWPPVNWPVWQRVSQGYTLEASIQGTGKVVAESGVTGTQSVQARYGWSLKMTCWPIGMD